MTEPENPRDYRPPAHASLAAALAAFQSDRPDLDKTSVARVPGKDGKQGYTYGYATLADVERAVLPGLGAAGLAWHCHTTYHGQQFVLVCSLMHESGESRESVFPLPNPNNPQVLGSALTYFKRYALMAATGVSAAEDDDDGAAASNRSAGHERATRADESDRRRDGDPQGSRQGAVDSIGWVLLTGAVGEIPAEWERAKSGGFEGWKVTERRAQAIRAHIAKLGLPDHVPPAALIDSALTGALPQIAAFRIVLEAWKAESAPAAEAVARAWAGLCGQQPRFSSIKIPGADSISDYVALVQHVSREADSDPDRNPAPPWDTGDASGAPEEVDWSPPGRRTEPWDRPRTVTDVELPADDTTPAYDLDDAEDNERPAVLEGT